ncbi:hypothetical protein JL101_035730 (plasmid) [Skermanella rosea]|uniref:hypothetical protein n=1 Tax=Skermanella rosea TaxID=1817965 RepID=UPI001931876A|nr:hypothetical protein [Skermanella rosea]UEM08003.1 hypothetical protein JL101_035730 [Skermanella rosea]
MTQHPFLSIRKPADLQQLPEFLGAIHYNDVEGTQDKNGNPLFRLQYDRYPHKDHAWGVETRGRVACPNHALTGQVKKSIAAHMGDFKRRQDAERKAWRERYEAMTPEERAAFPI